jgi:penicillin amidase
VAWNAEHVVPLLAHARAEREPIERARQRLLAWDKRVTSESAAAALYVFWERALRGMLVARELDPTLASDYLAAAANLDVPALARLPPATLLDALVTAIDDLRATAGIDATPAWGTLHAVLFQHPLAVTDTARRRFNVGPFSLAGYDGTVMASYGSAGRVAGGASFRQIIDVGDWDRSLVTNAPGQSGSPGRPHFSDFANMWASGEYAPLPFSDHAVQASVETTLVLTPRRRPQ